MPPVDFGFIGPTYQVRSRAADAERSVNLFPELIQSPAAEVMGQAKYRWVLSGTPGLSLFCALPQGPVRAIYDADDRVLAVAAGKLYEVEATGEYRVMGQFSAGDTGTARVAWSGASSGLFCIASGGFLYSWVPGRGLEAVRDDSNNRIVADDVIFADGYFVALDRANNRFYLSGLYDATAWKAIDYGTWLLPSALTAMRWSLGGLLWIIGTKQGQCWYNAGSANFPFAPVQGSQFDCGIVSPDGLVPADNTVFWLGRDTRGAGTLWRAAGYTPQRVSNPAVEIAFERYSRIDDAIAWSYQMGGHVFLVVTFPTADATWVYDVATQMWHEWLWWDGDAGRYRAHRAANHCYGYKKHLVGDRENGNVYELRPDVYTDNGAPIRRLRSSPHVQRATDRLFYSELILDMETGTAPETGQGTDPLIMLRTSNDGGFTWSKERTGRVGKTGDYAYRVHWHRLGMARRRCFEITYSEPTPVCFVNGLINVEAET